MAKHLGKKITLGSRVLVAGAAILGLAACQPVPTETTVPGNVTTPTYGPTTSTTTTAAPTTTTTTAPPANNGWKVVGGDEFNDSALDTGKWKPYYNTYGDGNNELACLMPKNITEGSGSLKIRAKKETVKCPVNSTTENYTSGFIGSRETGTYYPRYARFEIRAKLPHAQGLWPAFWLRHRNGASTAEVDVMEYFHSGGPGRSSQTLHLDGKYNISKKATPFEAPTLTPGFHVWAVEITPDPAGIRFTFFVDGAAVHTYVDAKHAWSAAAPETGTWDMAINLAVGGRWTGEPDGVLGYYPDLGTCAQGGTPPNACKTDGIRRVDWNNAANTTYEVDYVRVLTK